MAQTISWNPTSSGTQKDQITFRRDHSELSSVRRTVIYFHMSPLSFSGTSKPGRLLFFPEQRPESLVEKGPAPPAAGGAAPRPGPGPALPASRRGGETFSRAAPWTLPASLSAYQIAVPGGSSRRSCSFQRITEYKCTLEIPQIVGISWANWRNNQDKSNYNGTRFSSSWRSDMAVASQEFMAQKLTSNLLPPATTEYRWRSWLFSIDSE